MQVEADQEAGRRLGLEPIVIGMCKPGRLHHDWLECTEVSEVEPGWICGWCGCPGRARAETVTTITNTPVEQRRSVALARMDRAATFYGSTDKQWREVDEGDRITFFGTTDEGRQFFHSYQKETDEERASSKPDGSALRPGRGKPQKS